MGVKGHAAEPFTRLGISIMPSSDPIAGQVELPDGTTTPFEGYVQLIAAVERAHVQPEPGHVLSREASLDG